MPTSKRQRKEAKRLAKAATRSSAITQNEINHVETVIHSTGGVLSSDNDPANLEEIEEIERQLRYHGHVYNSQNNRSALKALAKLPEVDFQFSAEIERILEAFRVTDLIRRNDKNRGLQGKELRMFHALVESIRSSLVNDLVLVKKDELEVRMRRAGYLRYTNKSSYTIIEDRYKERDWKSGQRIIPGSGVSSSITSPSEEMSTGSFESSQGGAVDETVPENTFPPTGVDRRHLEMVHTRVSGEDGLSSKTIEPYPVLLSSAVSEPEVPKPDTLQSQVATDEETENLPQSSKPGWRRRSDIFQEPLEPVAPYLLNTSLPSPKTLCDSDALAEFGDSAEEVSPTTTGSPNNNASISAAGSRSFASRKKSKKAARESKRKAKRETAAQGLSAEIVARKEIGTMNNIPTSRASSNSTTNDVSEDTSSKENGKQPADEEILEKSDEEQQPGSLCLSPKSTIKSQLLEEETDTQSIQNGHEYVKCERGHDRWKSFIGFLAVDDVTAPMLACSHDSDDGASCLFMKNEVKDCPFHDPCK